MDSNKVQRLIDEVVAQSLEQTFHQRHAEAVDTWPAGRVLGLSGETLFRNKGYYYYNVMSD